VAQGWRPAGGATAAVLTMGASLAVPGRRNTNMIPIRQIQGVTTKRAGLWTAVKVVTGADTIEFRVSKAEAEQIKATLTQLMLGGGAPAPPAPAAASAAPAAPAEPAPALVADELAKLVQLRDAGALTDEEFAAQKARLLGS
jgi:Short C-terminal domain